jgi:hypothetical protein
MPGLGGVRRLREVWMGRVFATPFQVREAHVSPGKQM